VQVEGNAALSEAGWTSIVVQSATILCPIDDSNAWTATNGSNTLSKVNINSVTLDINNTESGSSLTASVCVNESNGFNVDCAADSMHINDHNNTMGNVTVTPNMGTVFSDHATGYAQVQIEFASSAFTTTLKGIHVNG
jgi:hypothetical protein